MEDPTSVPLINRLESYTLRYPQEVLLVQAQVGEDADTILIFRGFSSSLMRPTAFDPAVPMLPDNAAIQQLDRLQGPYQPDAPQYLEQGLRLEDFLARLDSLGL